MGPMRSLLRYSFAGRFHCTGREVRKSSEPEVELGEELVLERVGADGRDDEAQAQRGAVGELESGAESEVELGIEGERPGPVEDVGDAIGALDGHVQVQQRTDREREGHVAKNGKRPREADAGAYVRSWCERLDSHIAFRLE